MFSFPKRRSFPLVLQRDLSECGSACLAMIFKYHGLKNIQQPLREMTAVGRSGTTMYHMSEVAERFGFEVDGYHLTEFAMLGEIPLPCIAHYESNHFVVIYRVGPDKISIADPAYGKTTLTKKEYYQKCNGVVLTMTPRTDLFEDADVQEILRRTERRTRGVFRHFYWQTLKPFRRVALAVLVTSCILQLLSLLLPFFTQTILDQVLVHQNRKLLFAILAGLFAVFSLQVGLSYFQNLLLAQFKVQFELDFFSKFFYHLIRLRTAYFDAHKREDFINRFHENLKIRGLFSQSVLQSLVNFVFSVNFLIAMFLYNATLAAISLVFIVFYLAITLVYTPILRRLEEKIFHENLKSMGGFLDTLLGIQTVKLMALERIKFWKWRNQYRRTLNKVLQSERTYLNMNTFLNSIYLTGRLTVYWYGAYLTFGGHMTIGQYIAFITIFGMIMASLDSVSNLWFLVTETSITFDKLNDVLIQEPEHADLLQQQTHLPSPTIKLENVSFRYGADDERDVLKNINLEVKYGERIGIVGRNGSGKSTLLKLLVKLYTDYQGTILFNQYEMRDIHPGSLRRAVCMIPQEQHFFSGTIKENILYGNPDADMDAVIEAAKLADLHDYVSKLYLGYNHMIGESGSNLSGGQRLKIGFARLFLQDPEVIFLDEASSFLDVETEAKIMANLYRRFRDRTIITIAHRLHTLRALDRILVIDQGEIIEQGDHQALLNERGLYYTFIKTYVDF
ncbi:peptidase domain-containing ABC transporter [Acanthopleuribacter pedis]|uniref:Peptidase domain-containing ABC transporter n=1 Tax=Acanthopleuribacter pedis TaxID=442870 RepID=A0A8J7U4F9_9BACT|nr:peptidase domain-containing ABC transporter [Acanthopleuribacter pedis]MBO1318246.1 peptidase domain-containing ABC transporter [Acanthopleuribacter pedis]